MFTVSLLWFKPAPAVGVPDAFTAGQLALMPAGTVLVLLVPSGVNMYTVIPEPSTTMSLPTLALVAVLSAPAAAVVAGAAEVAEAPYAVVVVELDPDFEE